MKALTSIYRWRFEMGIYSYNKKPKFEIRKSQNEQYYFVLIAPNGEVISKSEEYKEKESCKKGIESVKKNASIAEVSDTTK